MSSLRLAAPTMRYSQHTQPVKITLVANTVQKILDARIDRVAYDIDNPKDSGVGDCALGEAPWITPTLTWPEYHHLIVEGTFMVLEGCEGEVWAISATGGDIAVSEYYRA